MKRKIKYWIPLFIVLTIFLIEISFNFWQSRIKMEEIGEFYCFKIIVNLLNIFVFCTCYFLTKEVIKNKKNGIWLIVLCVLAFVYPFFIGKWVLFDKFASLFFSSEYHFSDKPVILYNIYSLFSVIKISLYAVILYLGSDWYRKDKQTKELEKQNLRSELALLKNQINPHFLFNTLNNIDSLIKTHPSHASQSLIELSDMMRYMLYETKPERVSLRKELDYIENYLELQKLQYANPQLLDYSVSGNPGTIEVAPMLFIPFIENAFKHCTDKDKIHAIRLSFDIDSERILFQASNIADEKRPISKDLSSGIGMDTVRRRLEILYPNRYSLQIDKKNDLFCILLNLMFHSDD
jgi:sensor histidine kinase YesM